LEEREFQRFPQHLKESQRSSLENSSWLQVFIVFNLVYAFGSEAGVL